MKSIIPPVEFVSPLSETEVRLTLRELCGSKWDNFPFDGEIDKNSFQLIRNRFTTSRGVPKPILIGDFIGQGKQTKVTISLHTRITDFIGWLVFILSAIGLAGFVFISMLGESFILAIVSAVMICGLVFCYFVLECFWIWRSFHKSVNKIKKALGSILPRTDVPT